MEAHRSVTRRLQRKPLGDCTNTVSKTSQLTSSSATIVKFANPSLISSLKRLVDQTSIKEKIEDVNNLKVGAGSASKSLFTSVRPVTRRISADLGFQAPKTSRPSKLKDVDKLDAGSGSPSGFVSTRVRPTTRRISADLDFPASAPSRPRNSRFGVGDKEVAEPCSVYTVRRKASGKKRNKDASSSSAVASLRLDLISSPRKKRHQADEPKPSNVAPNKRQRMVKHEEDNVANGVSEDYLAQQRAYFAEVDAFELAEEEVSSSDLD